MLFNFEHILLPWGLKTISHSEPLLKYPFNPNLPGGGGAIMAPPL